MKKLSELYKASAEHWKEQIRQVGDFGVPHIPINTCPFCEDTVSGNCSNCRIDKTICSKQSGDTTIISLMFKLNRLNSVKFVIILAKVLVKIFEDKAKIHKASEDIIDILRE